MTAEEIHQRLLKVLADTAMNQSTVRNNNTPFQNDPISYHAVDRLSAQVVAVKVCCRAAGIEEERIRDVLNVCAL